MKKQIVILIEGQVQMDSGMNAFTETYDETRSKPYCDEEGNVAVWETIHSKPNQGFSG